VTRAKCTDGAGAGVRSPGARRSEAPRLRPPARAHAMIRVIRTESCGISLELRPEPDTIWTFPVNYNVGCNVQLILIIRFVMCGHPGRARAAGGPGAFSESLTPVTGSCATHKPSSVHVWSWPAAEAMH
jgi:hypothetical protein